MKRTRRITSKKKVNNEGFGFILGILVGAGTSIPSVIYLTVELLNR